MPEETVADYVIIGAEVGMARKALLGDQIVDAGTKDAIPLDVEFIGRLMVELSRRGPENVTALQRAAHEAQVKAAMMLQPLTTTSTAPPLTPAEKEAILEATRVEIRFEQREDKNAGGPGAEVNTRILVVPADRTLGLKQDELEMLAEAPGFQPPLSYELDHALMVSFFANRLEQLIASFHPDPVAGWTEALKTALLTHLRAWIADQTLPVNAAGEPALEDARALILSSPVRSFHRSVGIYATNMCR